MADGCVTNASGTTCPADSDWSTCRPWTLTQENNDNCFIDDNSSEAIAIAGADINLYKLLGVHEQTKLVDLIGHGKPISGGDMPGFPVTNAFTTYKAFWQSRQAGANLVASGYLGYDFGEVKIVTGRRRYGIDASVRHMITAIALKQGANPENRITKARIERSENGQQWYGVAVVNFPDDDNLNTVYFKQSVPNRYWRIRPIAFNGASCDSWIVQAMQMFDYNLTDITDIQDQILLENRDRDYNTNPIALKGYYDLINVSTDLSMFGIEIPSATYQIKINFNDCVAAVGRPIVIGDILELPSEQQYTPDMRVQKRYVQVKDVTWDATSYTPGWKPINLLITTEPAMATEETQDLFGDLAKHVDSSGLFDNDDGNSIVFQDYSNVSQTINQVALNEVPERGSEGSNTVREFTPEEIELAKENGVPHLNRIGFNPTGTYVEDAIPQNNAPFTEGPEYPTSPKNGDYHRLTYVGLAKGVPARLYRYSSAKSTWVYLETDRREQYNNQKEILDEYVSSPTKISARKIR